MSQHFPVFFVAVANIPHFGIWKGDSVRYDPTSPYAITVVRHLPPNHGALLGAIEAGALTPIAGDLAWRALSPAPPPPPPGHAARVLGWKSRRG